MTRSLRGFGRCARKSASPTRLADQSGVRLRPLRPLLERSKYTFLVRCRRPLGILTKPVDERLHGPQILIPGLRGSPWAGRRARGHLSIPSCRNLARRRASAGWPSSPASAPCIGSVMQAGSFGFCSASPSSSAFGLSPLLQAVRDRAGTSPRFEVFADQALNAERSSSRRARSSSSAPPERARSARARAKPRSSASPRAARRRY